MADLDALRKEMMAWKNAKSTSVSKSLTSANNSLEYRNHNPADNQEAERHFHLAECYDDGLKEFEVDYKKAMMEYLAAAELGHSEAMTNVSYDYSDSFDSILGYDLLKAEMWARRAIENGNPNGYKNLFYILEEQSKGAEAIEQLEIGITKHSLDCIEWLAFLLYWGGNVAEYNVEVDYDRAFSLLSSVEWDNNHSLALTTLGHLYRDRNDCVKAVNLYEKALAADSEDYDAMVSLGNVLRCEDAVKDTSRAKDLLQQAAQNGNFKAMNNLAVMLYLGDGTEQDKDAAINWLKKSAQGGFHQAMINLYDILSEDKPDEAMYWIKRAAKEGNEDAKVRIKEMESQDASIDTTHSDKIYQFQLSNIDNTLTLNPYAFTDRLSGIQKNIDSGAISAYEADRLRLLCAWMSLVYFKEHFCDDDYDDYEDKYLEILDKVDNYVGEMTEQTDEAVYLYHLANMYSAERFSGVNPKEKLNELWTAIQSIKLEERNTEFKVSIWEETAKEVHDLMSQLIDINHADSSGSSSNITYSATSSNDHLERKIIGIIASNLGLDKSEIHSYSRLDSDLGADSLDAVELIMEMEKSLNMEIPDEVAKRIRTVGDIVTYIRLHR